MLAGDIYLGVAASEVLLPATGRTFTEKFEELSREQRTANGRLVRDVIAIKKIVRMSYELVDGDDLDTFKMLYELQAELSFIHQRTNSTQDTYTVLLRPFDYTRLVLLAPGLWTGAVLELAEV